MLVLKIHAIGVAGVGLRRSILVGIVHHRAACLAVRREGPGWRVPVLPRIHHRLVLHRHVRVHVVGTALLRRGYNAAFILALDLVMRRHGWRIRQLLRLLTHWHHPVRVPVLLRLLLLLVVSLRVARAVRVVIHKQDRVLLLLGHHLLVLLLVVHHLMRVLLLLVRLRGVAFADWADRARLSLVLSRLARQDHRLVLAAGRGVGSVHRLAGSSLARAVAADPVAGRVMTLCLAQTLATVALQQLPRAEAALALRRLLSDWRCVRVLPAAVIRLVTLRVAWAAACIATVVLVGMLSVTPVLHRLMMRLLLLVDVLLVTFKGSATRMVSLPRAQIERRFIVDPAAGKPASPIRLLLVHHRQLELCARAAALVVIERGPVLLRRRAQRGSRHVPTLHRMLLLKLLVVNVTRLLGLRAVRHIADVAQVAVVRVLVAAAERPWAHLRLGRAHLLLVGVARARR